MANMEAVALKNRDSLVVQSKVHQAHVAGAPTPGKTLLRLWRIAALPVALVVTLLTYHGVRIAVEDLWIIVLVTLLLCWVGYPASSRYSRHPALYTPLLVAVSLWAPKPDAPTAALIAGLLISRAGRFPHGDRRAMRYGAAQLTLAAATGSWLFHGLPLHPVWAAALAAGSGFVATGFLRETLKWPVRGYQPQLRAADRWLLPLTLEMPVVVLLTPLAIRGHVPAALAAIASLLMIGRLVAQAGEIRDLRRQLTAAEAMGRASTTNMEHATSTALLQRFLELAQALVEADTAMVWTLDNSSGELTPAVSCPDAGSFRNQTALFGEGLIGHAAARVSPRLVADAARDPYRGQHETASGAWLLYPIVVHGQVLGVAHWVRSTSRPFTPEDIERLDALAPQATIALENIQIRAQLVQLADTDGLTGLWNQRRMNQILRDEVRRCNRYHRPLSILMLDVDSFKSFNDTFGHPRGDQLLCTISSLLGANVRNVDFVGRFGGEEFLIVLPETDKDHAGLLAERIRSAIEERGYIIVNETEVRRTVSIGLAGCPEDALNPMDLLQRADEALYRAKRSGKNCVIWA